MFTAQRLLGIPIFKERFRLSGRVWRINLASERAAELAVEILDRMNSHLSLFPLRDRIRAMRSTDCQAVLSKLIKITRDDQMRLVAIWLRGQCGGTLGTEVLAEIAYEQDERTRVAVAKALQRMSAWSVLKDMARIDRSPRVRLLASPRAPRDFRARLSAFTKMVEPIEVSPARQSFFWSPGLELCKPIRLKSADLIRRLLERIQKLVHGRA